MAAEFKIGRLRFSWKGVWTPATIYARDDVVSYQGKTYVCLLPNTSDATSFYNDLYYVTQTGASTPYWNMIVDGKTFVTANGGGWQTGQAYSLGNIVTFGGVVYYCNTKHTSTAFASQASYWTQYTEFNAWRSVGWLPNTTYGRNDVVKYGGIVYKCIANHTSAATTALGLEANQSSWTIVDSGVEYKGTWGSNTRYKTNDIVKFGPDIWISNSGHTSLAPTVLTSVSVIGSSGQLSFSGGTLSVGQSITVTGQLTPAATGSIGTGVTATYYVMSTDGSSTCILADTYAHAIAGTNQITTGIGTVPGLIFSINGFDQNKWSIWMPGLEYAGSWSVATVYETGDTVSYGGYTYFSKTANNIGNTPSVDATDWGVLTQGFNFRGEWGVATNYRVGDVVRRHGILFDAVADNTASDPSSYSVTKTYSTTGSSGNIIKVNTISGITVGMNVIGTGFTAGQTVIATDGVAVTVTLSSPSDTTLVDQQSVYFVGVNYINWKVVIPGRFWTKTWVNATTYAVGDLVIWQNGTYVCVQTHVASYSVGGGITNNRPDLDTANAYWIFYVPHARKNAMNTIGDLEYYSSTTKAYTALPISTDQYTLRATSTTTGSTTLTAPAWNKINQVGAVYYVSSKTGIDRADYGTTWDQPWKSIAYACNFIGAGTLLPNATANIVANKTWLTTEMYYWMLYQKSISANGFTPSSVFDQTKTIRDAGYVIDALVYDMARGGNSQTVAAALAYFAFGSTTTITNSTVLAELPYFIAALNQLGSLIQNVLSNTSPTLSVTVNLITTVYTGSIYQTLNSITPVIYQKFGASADLGANTTASSLLSIITTALTAQSTASLPAPNTGTTATIFVKTGNYFETLPIIVPENTAIVGDELRSVTVSPAISLTLQCTATNGSSNLVTVNSTSQFADQTALQFVNPTTSSVIGTNNYYGFGGITPGTTYYVVGSTITSTQFKITASTGTYYSVAGTNIASVAGAGATFNITPAQDGTYTVTVAYGGSNYVAGDIIKILSSNIGIAATTANLLITGFQYTITSVGTTDFTLLGAATNTVGLRFTATGAGTGTGTATNTANDITLTVSSINAGAILTVTAAGTTIFPLVTGSGSVANGTHMAIYAGDCIKDMFRLRNGTGLRNMTLSGLLGSLTNPDTYYIQKPTGGSYAALDPGIGPNDTSVWIFRRSPYVQNVTAFGAGAAGLKIDGNLHNGGNKSIVANDFTHIISDGIGVWCTGPNSLTEVVSVFSYYGYTGYFAEAGGRIRATNGNTSYGTYGVIAEGYDLTEVPATGIVFNQSSQVQAQVQSAFGSQAQLVRLTFSNAGSAYNTTTTNLLNYSNNFLGTGWVNDSNLLFNKNTTAPTGLTEAWSLTGSTAGPDGSYVYQNIAIPAAGATYSAVSGINITGSGGTGANSPATFNITVTATAYTVTVNSGGGGYVNGNTLYIPGSQLGGVDNVNDCIITVASVAGNAVLTVTNTGTVPINSALGYTASVFVKKGTSPIVDIYATFSGSSTVTSSISYNFDTNIVTPSSSGGGFTPINFGAINQQLSSTDVTAGWIRIWFSTYDTTGLNTQVQYRLYPRGYNGSIGQYTYLYGAQVELSKANYKPSFYLEVATNSKYSAYANYNVTGAGSGVVTLGDEVRSQSVFQARVVTDVNGITGGAGYLTASNNAQGGTAQYIQLAQADVNTNGNYTGMRVFVQGGTGAGQYGYISYYNSGTKTAYVLKESFATVPVTATASSGSLFTTTSTASMYLNQAVQFIPTYFTTSVNSTSLGTTTVTTSVGGTINAFTVASTVGLAFNQAVTFTGITFSTVSSTQTYYIFSILDATTIQITNQPYGTVWQLLNASGSMTMNFSSNTGYLQGLTANMVVNYPIQFTGTALGGLSVGTVYYINEIINSNAFTISTTLITLTVTAATAGVVNGATTAYWGTNYPTLSTSDTSSLIALNPVVFTSPMVGGLTDSQKYYIAKITSGTQFAVSSTILSVTVTKFEVGTNLITCSSTSGFQQDYPIRFVGAAINTITPETTYYISAVNNSTSFTITTLPGQQVIQCTATTAGYMTATTCPYATQVTALGGGGSMTLSSTSKKSSLGLGIGSMNATFSTQLFGNPQIGQTYYVQSIPDSLHFSVSTATGIVSGTSTSASPFGLADKTGSMSVAALGWDHINPGTPIVPTMDSSSQYYIEPRTIFTAPNFGQAIATSVVALAIGTSYTSMAYGNNYWIALPNAGSTAAGSSDGSTWTSITLPGSPNWSGIAYGNGYWIAISSGGASTSSFAISKSSGAGWRTTTVTANTWNNIAYGNGTFVVVATSTNNGLYSTNYGTTWTSSTLSATAPWSALAWGGSGPNQVNGGRFVAVASGRIYANVATTNVSSSGSNGSFNVTVRPSGYTLSVNNAGGGYNINDTIKILGTNVGGTSPTNDILITINAVTLSNGLAEGGYTPVGTSVTTSATIAAYSTTGATWNSVTLPASGAWSSIAYGNGIFVAVAGGPGATPVYSQDGAIWVAGNISISADKVSYGQGVFVAVSAGGTQAYTSENGSDWKPRTVTNDGYGAMAFGFVGTAGANQYNGVFATLAGRNTGSVINAGCQTKGRASIASNTITSINLFEPGSNYLATPTVSFVDPNVTTLASISPRLANGVLSSPTFVNRGSGYNTNSTATIVSGNGYSDQYQTGLQIILNNLTRLPSPGDNLTITGVNQIFKVTSAYSVFNTVVPNLEANVSVSPSISTANSTANGTVVSIRSKYSQARLTNHDFLNIGYGDFALSNYPNFPIGNYVAAQNNQSVEANYGRVFFTSTDQDGNFKVGNLFGVQQATGIVTLSASQFGLTGLNSLSLGGIAVGGSSTVITQFSTDGTFTANSDYIIPTQKAIKKYLTDRLSAGGSNTFTGQLTAGTVVVGGPNFIRSTVPAGTTGSNVKFTAKANFTGQNAAVDGNLAALGFYARNAFRGRQ
jgi:hypothetical protein